MAIRNTTHDPDGTAIAAIVAADLAGRASAQAGSPVMTAEELAVIQSMWTGLRGRGVERPMQLLLHAYHFPRQATSFSSVLHAALGGDDARSVENA